MFNFSGIFEDANKPLLLHLASKTKSIFFFSNAKMHLNVGEERDDLNITFPDIKLCFTGTVPQNSSFYEFFLKCKSRLQTIAFSTSYIWYVHRLYRWAKIDFRSELNFARIKKIYR